MLHASSNPPTNPSPSPSPASAFIQRLHASRSASFDSSFAEASKNSNVGINAHEVVDPGVVASALGLGNGNGGGNGNRNGFSGYVGGPDLRRATSLKAAGLHGGTGSRLHDPSVGVVSFGAAGSDLSSPTVPPIFTPPAASRYALFSHHALPPPSTSQPLGSGPNSPSIFSDPGPPSPTPSDISSNAFSPASAFLSHFSSSTSLRAPANLAPDSQGARVLDYTLGKIIGRGGFSAVRKATHVTTGEIFACKIVKRDDLSDRSGSLEKFEDEISIWRTFPRHHSILPLLDMHRTPFATFLIMPFLPGGSLLDVLQREGGSDKTARKFFPGVVAAVSALHDGFQGFEGGILHGDLKLDNFLVDHAGGVMVCDFYMAQKVGWKDNSVPIATVPPPLTGVMRHTTLPTHFHRGPRMSSPLPAPNSHRMHDPPEPIPTQAFPSASLPYAPPELLRGPRTAPSLAQDMWAVGIILHALLTGRLPFVDSFDPRLQMKILRGSWDEPPDMGREWLECLRGCLHGNMDGRWTIGRVRESDAVLGWTEVKSRSKSRSRSRARKPVGDGLLDSRRREAQALPVPIRSPNIRIRKGSSASHDHDHERGGQRTMYGSLPAQGPHDFFNPLPKPTMEGSNTLPQPRSRSASASRSRSRGQTPMFEFDAPDLIKSLEISQAQTRGRSTRRDIGQESAVQGLPFQRQSGTMALTIDGLQRTSAPSSRSRSAARTPYALSMNTMDQDQNQGLPPGAAPPYTSNMVGGRGTGRSPSTSRSRSSRESTSPNVSTSRSRDRGIVIDTGYNNGDGDGVRGREKQQWDVNVQRYSYGRELGAVHEEGSRGRGRQARSRSRGRLGFEQK